MSTSEDQDILVADAGHIRTITINRSGKLNALTHAMYTTMANAIIDADTREDIRVLLLTGGQKCFTAGNDLKDFDAGLDDDFMNTPVGKFLGAISRFSKPVVAAVNGVAVGIGTTMLLHCDLIFAGNNARFRMPFVNLGLCPEGASSYLLPKIMGHARAAELLLLGEEFDNRKAFDYGIINHCTAVDDTFDEALAAATRLAAQPTEAVIMSKKMLKEGESKIVEQTLAKEGGLFFERLSSPEAKSAFARFLGKKSTD